MKWVRFAAICLVAGQLAFNAWAGWRLSRPAEPAANWSTKAIGSVVTRCDATSGRVEIWIPADMTWRPLGQEAGAFQPISNVPLP